jgi:ribosomal protein L40E
MIESSLKKIAERYSCEKMICRKCYTRLNIKSKKCRKCRKCSSTDLRKKKKLN